MNVKTITDVSALGKLIDAIKKAGTKLDNDIHVAAVSALARLADHGDIGYCNRLYLALPKGVRKAAMTSWLLAYGSLKANTDTATKAETPFVFTKDKACNVADGMADPWYDHKPDQKPDEVFDLQAALQAVLKKAQGKTLVHGELVAGIQGLLATAAGAAQDEKSGAAALTATEETK